jgi:hypothetical protein
MWSHPARPRPPSSCGVSWCPRAGEGRSIIGWSQCGRQASPPAPASAHRHTGTGKPPPVRGGVVELHLTVDELQRYAIARTCPTRNPPTIPARRPPPRPTSGCAGMRTWSASGPRANRACGFAASRRRSWSRSRQAAAISASTGCHAARAPPPPRTPNTQSRTRRNSPQQAPLGLYAEQISGTAFTAPRSHNRRTWAYRLRPSAAHPSFTPIDSGNLRGAPIRDCPLDPNRLRWDPLPLPERSARTATSTPRPASRSTSIPRRSP